MSSLIQEQALSIVRSWARERGIVIEDVREDGILAREGDNTVLIKLVLFEDFPDVDRLNSTLMELAKDRNNFNKVYVALQSEYVHLLDGKLLKKLSIGVLGIDFEKGTVVEVLPSPAIRIRKVVDIESIDRLRPVIAEIVNEQLSKIIQEIRILETRISALEDRVRQLESKVTTSGIGKELKEELNSLWNVVDRLKLEIERLKTSIQTGATVSPAEKPQAKPVMVEEAVQEAGATPSEGVPDFLRDNPWVQILAKKASER